MGKQKKSIKDINIKKLAVELGFSYLEGKYGYWSNAAGKIISYDSMDNDYLNNCINFIDKGIKELKNNSVDSDIKRQISKMINITQESISEKDVKSIRKDIIDLIKCLKSELVEYKEMRDKNK